MTNENPYAVPLRGALGPIAVVAGLVRAGGYTVGFFGARPN